ncbi:MAG: hypothetical protein QW095_06385, partial [Nitrososphaerota archaeon]
KNIRALDSGKRLGESFRNELLKIFFSTLEKNVTFLNRTAPIKTHIRLQPIRLAKYLLGYTDTYRCFDVV